MHEGAGTDTPTDLEAVLEYHERTKHQPQRYARSLGYLDWATQPNPFRLYEGAELLILDEVPPKAEPTHDAVFDPGRIPPRPADRESLSQLLYDSLALSAWKDFQGNRWSLRVNPSSGDLHPTEGYVISGPVPGLLDRPAVCHYSPFHHGLEVRAELSPEEWLELSRGLPCGALIVGLASIYWRESWKYGERAFRYCQHDVGHAIAAVAIAAAVLGWESRLLEGVTDGEAATLLGISSQAGPEAERPDCLVVLYPAGQPFTVEEQIAWRPPSGLLDRLSRASFTGKPNRLSSDHHLWPIIETVSAATLRHGSPGKSYADPGRSAERGLFADERPLSAREIIRRRRSAVAMDGSTHLSREGFYRLIEKVLPVRGRPPFAALPWPPAVHLVLFVHRVKDLESGMYLLARSSSAGEELRSVLRNGLSWIRPPGCPGGLDLHMLLADDTREAAQAVSCQQEIASDGAFAVGMLTEFEARLRSIGPWFYKRLHWEAGALGQVLYLEAEAAGVRGTGIGCFFDNLMHQLLGIEDRRYQTLYHFTVGGFLEDSRLRTLPAYFHR